MGILLLIIKCEEKYITFSGCIEYTLPVLVNYGTACIPGQHYNYNPWWLLDLTNNETVLYFITYHFVWEFKGTAQCLLCIFPWMTRTARYCPGSIWRSLAREARNAHNKPQWKFFSSREICVIHAKYNNNNHNSCLKIIIIFLKNNKVLTIKK